MAKIHFVLQGKGGVGKSVISSLLTQSLLENGQVPLCVDTDPVNNTFQGYASLNVKRIDLIENDEIEPSRFDDLIELIAAHDGPAVIDSGASSFVALAHYIVTNGVIDVLEDMGHEVVIHSVIAGGQALLDTVSGFAQLVKQFPESASFVVWLNHFFGEVAKDDKKFKDMKVFQNNSARISSIIELPELKAATFGKDFAQMLEKRQTFKEAIADASLGIMSRQRLKTISRNIFAEIDSAELV